MTLVSTSRWVLIRGALEEVTGRFAELLRTVADPDVRAVGDWTIADTATHLREVTLLRVSVLIGSQLTAGRCTAREDGDGD